MDLGTLVVPFIPNLQPVTYIITPYLQKDKFNLQLSTVPVLPVRSR